MKRVLVTGAGGQLGKSIQDLASEYPDLDFLFLDKAGMDITRADQVMAKFREYRPDYCINCAAYTQVDQAEKTPEPAFEVNAKGVENLARACSETHTVLIHISTDYVFDGEKMEGYLPDDTPNPINAYGRSKWEGEKRIREWTNNYFIIRTSWLYSRFPTNFYTTIKSLLERGEDMEITDAQVGCPTRADRLARYLLSLIVEADHNYGVRHFSDGTPMSWHAFARWIKEQEVPGSPSRIAKGNNYRSFAKRPRYSILLPLKKNVSDRWGKQH